MLENCTDLPSCENILADASKNVRLLGDIPFSDGDLDILANLICQKIKPNLSKGSYYLRKEVPTCFACFLVGMGRFYDKESGYWPAVEKKVGLSGLKLQEKCGQAFLEFLEKNNLPKFDEEKGLLYVTPILNHAGIPYCCLDEFFERILVPLVRKDLLNPSDRSEIIHDLNVRRQMNGKSLELEQESKRQTNRLRILQGESRRLSNQIQKNETISSLLMEEQECKKELIALQGLENFEADRANLIDRITGVKERIHKLESDGQRLWGEIIGFKHRYEYIHENGPQIYQILNDHLRLGQELNLTMSSEKSFFDAVVTQWMKLSADPWDDKLGDVISGLSLEQLLSFIPLYKNTQDRLLDIRVQIEKLRASQEERKPSLPIITALLSFFRKTIFQIRRKKKLPPPSELQQLESTYRETETELECQLEQIKGLLVHVPLQDRLLDNPSAELYEKLCSLKVAHAHLVKARETQNKLEEDLDHLAKQIRGLLPVDMAVDDDINALAKLLRGEIEEADRAQSTALRYEKNLELEIRPILEKARIELRSLNTNIEKLDTQLTQLGEGSSQRGLDIVREFNQQQARIMKTRKELSSRYSDFEVIEGELLKQGWEGIKPDLEKTALDLEQQKQLIKGELQNIGQGYENSSIQYPGIDEPIRRFLLYGGSSAEEFLVDSVALFARVKSGEKPEEIIDLRLPSRVVQSFQKWWELRSPLEELRIGLEEDVDPITGQRFRAPQLIFDPTTAEILVKVSPQRYLRRKRETAITLEVYGSDSPIPITTSQLKLYGTSEGLAEARLQDAFALSAPSEKYIFNLKTKDDLIYQWKIEGLTDEKPYLAFLADSHKSIKDKSLPRSTLIIVTSRELKIQPIECILLMEGSSLYGGWKDYIWYEIDAASSENLYLTTDQGSPVSISLQLDVGCTPTLIGGVQSETITSDERPVFTVAPKFVRIPANNQEDLNLWRVSLLTWVENRLLTAKHYQASELTNIIDNHAVEGWFDIPLNAEQLLGQAPLGCYTLRIYKPPYLDWQPSFCIIPELDVSFGQEIYPPFREPIPDVRATIILPEHTVFVPDKPAEITSRDGNSWSVHVSAFENVITGEFQYPLVDGQENKFPIAVTIPKIRWRFQGSGDPQNDLWSDKVKEELWLGDWMDAQELYLIAEMPWFFTGRVSLAWEGNPVTVEAGKMHDQKVRFDMKALIDILRAGPPLGTITLSLTGAQTNISSIPLFTVRTRWQTENIKCFRYPEGEFIRLNVTWDERGRTDKKVIRLWYYLHEQSHIVQEQRVDRDVCEVEFKINLKDLNPGNYLIHIEPDDPWSSQPAHLPDNIQNAILIEIIHEAPKETVILHNIWVDAYHTYYLQEGTYKIRVIDKVLNRKLPENVNFEDIAHILVTPHNEGWYVGILEVVDVPEVNKYLHDTNPVKFDYDPIRNLITSIEDRHGDGAVYCYQCGMLFWCQETALNEKSKGHRNYGPIEQFGIVWESEKKVGGDRLKG